MMPTYSFPEAARLLAVHSLQRREARDIYEDDKRHRALDNLLKRQPERILSFLCGRKSLRLGRGDLRPVPGHILVRLLQGAGGIMPQLERAGRCLAWRSLVNAETTTNNRHSRATNYPVESHPDRSRDQETELRDQKQKLCQCLLTYLDRIEREVIRLSMEGSNSRTIGDALSLSPGNVDVIRHRAIRKLRDRFGAGGLPT